MGKGTRGELLDRLAGAIESVTTSHPLRVAVDGPPAAGKTTLADELALLLRARGREVIRTSTESFHLPRAHRYRRGEFSTIHNGFGQCSAGDVASRIATETISEFFRTTANEDVTWPFHFDTNLSEEENRLLTGIRVANRQIFERSTRSREYYGMGTTVVGAMFSPQKGRMYIGHVGDSRCYRVRTGEIRLLTRDHSLINDYLLAMPDLTDEQKSELPKNVITRALGMQDHVVVDLQHDDPQSGDVYVLCSDGLSGMVSDGDIQQIVADAQDVRDACRQLIQRANERGGEDNITAVLIRIESSDDAAIGASGGATKAAGATGATAATGATGAPTGGGDKAGGRRPGANGRGSKKVGT